MLVKFKYIYAKISMLQLFYKMRIIVSQILSMLQTKKGQNI